jgi:hypothetical protein
MNKMKALLADKGFQKVVLTTTGYTVAYAIFALGVIVMWKWYIGYQAAATGIAILKGTAVAGTAVVGGVTFCKSYKQWKKERATQLAG